jgi:hypothetical protein
MNINIKKNIIFLLITLVIFSIICFFLYQSICYKKKFYNDLESIVYQIKSNYPGWDNKDDKKLRSIIKKIELIILDKSISITTRNSYVMELKKIASLFEDSHLYVADIFNDLKKKNEEGKELKELKKVFFMKKILQQKVF